MRSHGKWGDFLVALIPLSWCGNILINSNFILRMLEWQNESSLFVVRIQGKQWYWAYKYNSDTNFRLNNVFINVGNNNWMPLMINSNKYFSGGIGNSLNNFIYEYEFKQLHRTKLKNARFSSNNNNQLSLNSNFEVYTKNFKNLTSKENKILNTINKKIVLNNNIKQNKLNCQNNNHYKTVQKNNYKLKNINYKNINYKNIWQNSVNFEKIKSFNSDIYTKLTIKNSLNNLLLSKNRNIKSKFENDKLENTFISAENMRLKNNKFPIKLITGVINKHNTKLLTLKDKITTNILFNLEINYSDFSNKPAHVEQFWGFRQKRYKKLQPHSFLQNTKYSNTSYKPLTNYLQNQSINKYHLYASIKNNRYKSELISVTLARRLLRTKRTLILPVHINIRLLRIRMMLYTLDLFLV